MKSFKQFLKEQPTMSGGNPQAYSQAADASGPVAGFDKRLFPANIDDLDQGYQTPAEPGQAHPVSRMKRVRRCPPWKLQR